VVDELVVVPEGRSQRAGVATREGGIEAGDRPGRRVGAHAAANGPLWLGVRHERLEARQRLDVAVGVEPLGP
jgi:hypothetical protein